MRKQIQLWGTRVLSVGVLVFAVQHWGVPAYKDYFTPKKVEVYVPTAKVRFSDFTVSFHELGTLEAIKSVPVNSEVSGKIITLVAGGKHVVPGQEIAVLDTTDMEKEVRNQELAYQNAEADVNRAKAELAILKESNKTEVEQAEAQLNFDSTELERARKQLAKKQRLAEEKLVPTSEVEQAELEVKSKELAVLKGTKALALKKKEVESKEQQKLADVRNVEFKASMAKFSLDDIKQRVKKAVVTAPAAGLVVISKDWTPDGRRPLKAGDSVHPRQTICELPDLSQMKMKVNVGEADAPRVKAGMPVLIRLEAVPKKVFHGTVKEMSNLATEPLPWETGATPGRKNFEVTILVKETDPKTLKPGMTGDVEFIEAVVKQTLYVPIEAVIEQHGKTFVFVKEGKRYKKVPVEIGKNNDNFVCITKGLKKGQIIALRDPTQPIDEDGPGASSESDDKQTGSKDKKGKKEAAPIPGAAER